MPDISVRRFQRTYASAATSRQERSIKTTSSKTTSTSRSFNSIEDETNQSSDSTRPPSPDFIRKGKTPASPLSTFGSSATSDFSFVTTKPTQVRSSITTYFEESKTSGNSEVDNSAIIESRKFTTDNMVRNNPNPTRETSLTKSADVTSRSVAYQAHLKDLPVLQKEVPVSPPPSSVGSSMNSDSSYASVKQSNVRSSATIYEQSKSSSNVTNKQFSNPSAVKQNKFSSNSDKVKYSTDKNKLIIDARHLIRQTSVEDKVPKNVGFVTSVATTYEEHVKELQANPGVVTDASYVAIRPNKVPSIIEYFERTKTSRDYPLASVGQLGKGREPTLDYSALNEANRLSRSSSNLVTNETKRISRSSSNLASNESKRISRSSSNLERNVSTNFLRSTSDLEMNNQKYRGWENEDYYEKRKFWRSLSNEGRESSSEVRNVRFNDAKVSRSSSNLAINEKTSRSRNLTSNESKFRAAQVIWRSMRRPRSFAVSRSSSNLAINEKTSRSRNLTSNESNRVSRSSSNEAKRFSRSSSNLAINESKVSRSSSNLALNESKRLSHSASTEQSKQSRNSEVRNVTFNISNKYLENLSHNERHVEDIYAVSTKPVTRRVSNKYVEKTKSKFEDKGANTKSVNYAVYGAKNKFEDSSVSSKNISSKKRFEGSSFSTDSIYHADDYTDYGSKTQLIDSSVSTKTKIVDHSSSARFADSTQFVGSAASKHLTYKEHLDETPPRPTPALRSSSSSIYYTSSSSVPMILPRIVDAE
ncbi:uncharacterized protein LOC103506515 [Diaphorina citri]|uniref:Uncharacterized protein LOC103506515 n=1 Tax=Diaphorina citri TaxID=121845 RepID=A0A3Q0IRV1_DIACI|nr:uncharacterized protein LOC103506515 [Diaphorina citri]